MVETLNSRETEASQTNSHEVIPYIPKKLNIPQENNDEDANDILKQLDDTPDKPQLSEDQKNEMYIRCKQKAEEISGHLSTISSSMVNPTNKESAFNNFKELCNPDVTITIRTKYNNIKPGEPTGTSRRISINEFWNKIKNNEIDLKNYNLSAVFFNKGEFIKKEIPMPGGKQIIWNRKINNITLETKGEENPNVYLGGLEDITTIKNGFVIEK